MRLECVVGNGRCIVVWGGTRILSCHDVAFTGVMLDIFLISLLDIGRGRFERGRVVVVPFRYLIWTVDAGSRVTVTDTEYVVVDGFSITSGGFGVGVAGAGVSVGVGVPGV